MMEEEGMTIKQLTTGGLMVRNCFSNRSTYIWMGGDRSGINKEHPFQFKLDETRYGDRTTQA